jgi:hypothetical protein
MAERRAWRGTHQSTIPEVQLELASIWVEFHDKLEWQRFANHRALRPSDHLLRQMSTQLHVALPQAEASTVESDRTKIL